LLKHIAFIRDATAAATTVIIISISIVLIKMIVYHIEKVN